MNTLNFFRRGIFALLVAATALVACSKDSDDNEFKYTNTVTLNGVEKKITRAEYKNAGGGDYLLLLYLNNSDNERVELHLNKDNHMKGNTIVLTQKDTSTKGWHWIVEYYDSSDSGIITAGGKDDPLQFKSGTLTISAPPESGKDITILLNNGKVIGTDGKTEYTLTLNYSGEMEKK